MKRAVDFWFVAPPLLLRDQRHLEVRTDRAGREYVMARTPRGRRVRVLLDEPSAVFVTKDQPQGGG